MDAITGQDMTIYPFKIQEVELYSYQSLLNFGYFREVRNYFNMHYFVDLKRTQNKFAPEDLLYFEFSLDSENLQLERDVYNFLDFLGDAGGLFDGSLYFARALLWMVGLLTQNPLTMYIVSRVYNHELENENGGSDADSDHSSTST